MKYKKEWWFKVSNFESNLLNESDLENWLENCKDELDMKCLLLLYYTGARPSELCLLKWGNLHVLGDLIAINLVTLKRGVPRTIFIPVNEYTIYFVLKLEKMSLDDKNTLVLDGLKWYNIRDRIYRITENKMCPYFFRHNRLSQLADKGASIYELKTFKGSKRIDSVEVYTTRAGTDIKKLAKLIK